MSHHTAGDYTKAKKRKEAKARIKIKKSKERENTNSVVQHGVLLCATQMGDLQAAQPVHSLSVAFLVAHGGLV